MSTEWAGYLISFFISATVMDWIYGMIRTHQIDGLRDRIKEVERKAERQSARATFPRLYQLIEAAENVVNWHDSLDGDMDNAYGHKAIERLRESVSEANTEARR